MEISVYGTRGSVPVSGREYDEFGGNTTCVGVRSESGKLYVLDAGTGIRKLNAVPDREMDILLTHAHWDHIQGLPFFTPAYNPQRCIRIHGGTTADLYTALKNQHAEYNFPVPFELQKGIERTIDFVAGGNIFDDGEMCIDTLLQNHPKQGSVSYRLTERKRDGSRSIFVFGTDYEPDDNGYDERMIEFWAKADLVFADAQFEPRDSSLKINSFMKGWGHSDYATGVWLATLAEVRAYNGTHHDPSSTDGYLRGLEERAQQCAFETAHRLGKHEVAASLAREGAVYHI